MRVINGMRATDHVWWYVCVCVIMRLRSESTPVRPVSVEAGFLVCSVISCVCVFCYFLVRIDGCLHIIDVLIGYFEQILRWFTEVAYVLNNIDSMRHKIKQPIWHQYNRAVDACRFQLPKSIIHFLWYFLWYDLVYFQKWHGLESPTFKWLPNRNQHYWVDLIKTMFNVQWINYTTRSNNMRGNWSIRKLSSSIPETTPYFTYAFILNCVSWNMCVLIDNTWTRTAI